MFLLSAALMTLVCQTVSSQYIVNTPVGSIRGIAVPVGNDTTYQFRNIPYGKAPIGDLRFRKPVPYGSWIGIRDGRSFGPSCMQDMNNSYTFNLENKNISEDCLSLNVYVPHQLNDINQQNRSVMVWVHGGSYIEGQGQLYNATMLASRGDVIVVTINYRLGFFGFLSTGDAAARGNYGLWDQHLAFKWVRNNIASFGGNPNSVTIFGESAGGFSVSLQSFATQNKGLFQRVIAESGASNSFFATTSESLAYSKRFGMLLGCINSTHSTVSTAELISCMRQKSSDELLAAQMEPSIYPDDRIHFDLTPGAVVDGEFLTDTPTNILRNQNSESHKFFKSLDFLSGNCNSEGSLFLPTLYTLASSLHFNANNGVPTEVLCNNIAPDLVKDLFPNASTIVSDAICNKYTASHIGNQGRQIINMYTDVFFLIPTLTSLDLHSSDNNQTNTYRFIFDIPLVLKYGPSPPTWFQGSAHVAEIIFVFGIQSFTKQLPIPDSYIMLSEKMMKYWTNFAKTGNPNADGLPFWPKYEKSRRAYIDFDIPISEGANLYRNRMDFWLKSIPALMKVHGYPIPGFVIGR